MLLTEKLQTHPIADLMPSMSEEEYKNLIEDIKVNGLIEPIYLYEGKILDGRHRYRACTELGIEPRFEEYSGNSPVSFVISKNLKRRHLTESQKAALAVELLPYIEKEAKERQIKAGESGGKYGVLGGRGIKKGSGEYNEKVSQFNEQDNQELKDLNKNTDNDSDTSGNGKKPLGGKFPPRGLNRGRSTEIAAKLVDSNQKYVKTAKKLSQQAPEVFDVVKEGKINIMQAKKIAELPEEVRKSVVEKVKDNTDNKNKTVEKVIAEAKKQVITSKIENLAKKSVEEIPNVKWDGKFTINTISQADITEINIPENSIDLIFTDPPYHDEYIELYDKLGKLAQKTLKDGAFCIVYCGKMFLPEVINKMQNYLEYVSIFAVFHPFSKSKINKYKIFENWRPILLFKKSGENTYHEWVQDAVIGKRDKEYHEWQQDEQAPLQLIKAFTVENQIVLDPFVGGGTIPYVCKKLNRNFIAFDKDETAVRLSIERLKKA